MYIYIHVPLVRVLHAHVYIHTISITCILTYPLVLHVFIHTCTISIACTCTIPPLPPWLLFPVSMYAASSFLPAGL